MESDIRQQLKRSGGALISQSDALTTKNTQRYLLKLDEPSLSKLGALSCTLKGKRRGLEDAAIELATKLSVHLQALQKTTQRKPLPRFPTPYMAALLRVGGPAFAG
jgi:hypothetical protein